MYTDVSCFWDLAHDTINIHKPPKGRRRDQFGLVIAPNGLFMVSVGEDAVIQVWDVEDAHSLVSRAVDDPVIRLVSAELNDGWLIGPSGELLLWVPADYQEHLEFHPYPRRALSQRRIVVTVGNQGLHWGDDWHKCWRGAVS